ncbi:MAG TPA: NAD-dependent epimerase/dehydratase family protein, partial [Albitalea sp.]|nr:NAD-dependent epimerase/dehydratase family protein [Albitalea sp.]
MKALTEAAWSVRVLAASPGEPGLLGPDVEIRVGDIADWPTVCAASEGVEAVVHMAALLHETSAPSAREEYERTNVGGTAAVVSASQEAGARRLVYFSTIAVYGDLTGVVADERTPPHPDTVYGQTKLAGEELVLRATAADGTSLGTVLRVAAAYGPRIKGNYRRLVRALAHHRFLPVGSGLNRRTLIFDQDLATATVLALQRPEAAGKIYNVSDGQLHTVRDVVRAVCEALGRRAPRAYVPLPVASIACGFAETAGRLVRVRPPFGRQTLRKYTEDMAVTSRRIQTELGFRPAYDLRAGWRA